MSFTYTEDAPVIQSIHPKVAEFYKINNLEYIPRVEDHLKFIFETVTQGNPVSRRINSMTRVKRGSSEFIWTDEDLISTDSNGNTRQFNQRIGKYDMPHPFREYVQSENATVVTAIDRTTTEYEIPYTKEALKELLEFTTDDTGYTLESGNVSWTISKKDFCERDFDAIANSRRK